MGSPDSPTLISAVRSPEHQLALQLFNDFGGTNTSIADIDTDVGFNINQMLVDVKDLTALARKALVGCYFLAATSPENPSAAYDFDLGFFKWLINFSSSNNLAHLKKVLRETQKAAIEANLLDPNNPSKDKWTAVPLMGPVAIAGGRIAFKLPTELVAGLKNPNGIMMYLSLRIQANFTSIYAQTLFAKAVPMASAGATPWMTLPEFSKWMNIDQWAWAKEFRYLNRDVIKVALEQINEHSDLVLTLETRKVERRVESLRFAIERKRDWGSTAVGVISEKEIYDTLKYEFKMCDTDLDEVMKNRNRWTNTNILDAIAYTRQRLNNPDLDFLRKPGNYFLTALKNGYVIVTEEKRNAEIATQEMELKRRQAVQEKTKLDKMKKAAGKKAKSLMDAFWEMDPITQNELWNAYLQSVGAKTLITRTQKKMNDGQAMDRDALLAVDTIQVGFMEIVKQRMAVAR